MNSENELVIHVHRILDDYVYAHITRDHHAYTRELAVDALSESLQDVPDHDPSALVRPRDPLEEVLQDFDDLSKWQEPFTVTEKTRKYVAQALKPVASRALTSRCERIWSDEGPQKVPSLAIPMSPKLSTKSRTNTPLKPYARIVKPWDFRLSLCLVDGRDDHALELSSSKYKFSEVRLCLDSDTHHAVLQFFKSTSVIKSAPSTRAFTQEDIPLEPPASWATPQSPPVFARATHARPRRPAEDIAILTEMPPVETGPSSDHSIALREQIVVVDGWHAFRPQSSPSPLCSPSLGSPEFHLDELLPSPSPVLDANEIMSMDEHIMPRSERIYGSLKPVMAARSQELPRTRSFIPTPPPSAKRHKIATTRESEEFAYSFSVSNPNKDTEPLHASVASNVDPTLKTPSSDDRLSTSSATIPIAQLPSQDEVEYILKRDDNVSVTQMEVPKLPPPPHGADGDGLQQANLGSLIAFLIPQKLKSRSLNLSWSLWPTAEGDFLFDLCLSIQNPAIRMDRLAFAQKMIGAFDDATPFVPLPVNLAPHLRLLSFDETEVTVYTRIPEDDIQTILLSRRELRRLQKPRSESNIHSLIQPVGEKHDDLGAMQDADGRGLSLFKTLPVTPSPPGGWVDEEHEMWTQGEQHRPSNEESTALEDYSFEEASHSPFVSLCFNDTRSFDAPQEPSHSIMDGHHPEDFMDHPSEPEVHPSAPSTVMTISYAKGDASQDGFAKLHSSIFDFLRLRLHSSHHTLKADPQLPTPATAPRSVTHEHDITNRVDISAQLHDSNSLILPTHPSAATHIHRYLACLEVVTKSALTRCFASSNSLITLLEREYLNGADIIVDPDHAVIFISLFGLSHHAQSLHAQLINLTGRFDNILVIFEAYLPTHAFKNSPSGSLPTHGPDAFSPASIKAIRKLRRDLNIAEACGHKRAGSTVFTAFARNIEEAALFVRGFGDRAEQLDKTQGRLWGRRSWLTDAEDEGESSLGAAEGMNPFAAAVILSQVPLDVFLYEMDAETRLAQFGNLVGEGRIRCLNAVLAQRIGLLGSDLPSSSPFTESTPQDSSVGRSALYSKPNSTNSTT